MNALLYVPSRKLLQTPAVANLEFADVVFAAEGGERLHGYRTIPKQRRARLHERVAAWLEQSIGQGSAEHVEIAGYHLEQCYRYRTELALLTDEDRELARRAAGLLVSAGQRAFRRGDMPASAKLLERSVSLLSTDDHAALELLPDLGYALFEVGELERANTVLAEAIVQGRARGNRDVQWNATVKLANARMYTNPEGIDPDSLVNDATAAIDVLDELGDELGLARAWSCSPRRCSRAGR